MSSKSGKKEGGQKKVMMIGLHGPLPVAFPSTRILFIMDLFFLMAAQLVVAGKSMLSRLGQHLMVLLPKLFLG